MVTDLLVIYFMLNSNPYVCTVYFIHFPANEQPILFLREPGVRPHILSLICSEFFFLQISVRFFFLSFFWSLTAFRKGSRAYPSQSEARITRCWLKGTHVPHTSCWFVANPPSQATMTPEQQEEFEKAVQQHINKPSSRHRPRQQTAAAADTADPSQCSGSETTRLLDSRSNNMVRTSRGSIPQIKCHRFLHQVWPRPDEAAAGRGHVSPRPGQQHAAEYSGRLRTIEGEAYQQLRKNKMAASFHTAGHAQPRRPQTQPHDEWDVGPPSHRQ